MSTLNQLQDLIIRHRNCNNAGAVKNANALLPQIFDLFVKYIDERTAGVQPVVNDALVAPVAINETTKLEDIPADEQDAYIEAMRRVQNITNYGAKYLGDEATVQKYVDLINNEAKGQTCEPCDPANMDDLFKPLPKLETVAQEVPAKKAAPKKAPAKKPAAKKPATRKPRAPKA